MIARSPLHFIPFTGILPDSIDTTCYHVAYHRLLDGIRRRAALMVLSGIGGSGKTVLLRRLLRDAPGRCRFVYYCVSGLDYADLSAFICQRLGLGCAGDRATRIDMLSNYLDSCSTRGIKVILVVDAAERLADAVLGQLLVVARRKRQGGHCLQLVLAGVPALVDKVSWHQALHPIVASAVYCRLERLSASGVDKYICRQLQHAGIAEQILFSPAVIDHIVHYGDGIPGRINALCYCAMAQAYATEQYRLSVAMIDEAAARCLPRQAPIEQPDDHLLLDWRIAMTVAAKPEIRPPTPVDDIRQNRLQPLTGWFKRWFAVGLTTLLTVGGVYLLLLY